MEPVLIYKTATVLLALAAVGGVAMALIRFGGAPHPPAWLAMLHGALAIAALTLLIYAAATVHVNSMAGIAIVLFAIAGAGGGYLNLRYHMQGVELPKWLILVHGGIAVVGFLCLLLAWL
jgi:hypothetical protein